MTLTIDTPPLAFTPEQEALLDEWADLLDSGMYKQGECCLHDPEEGGYCCLGVLCKMLADKGLLPEGARWDAATGMIEMGDVLYATLPPPEVWDMVVGPHRVNIAGTLSMANDAKGKSFSDIARAIRARTFFLDEEWACASTHWAYGTAMPTPA